MGKYTCDASGNIIKAEYKDITFTKNTEIFYPEEIHIDKINIAKNITIIFHSTQKNRDIFIDKLNLEEPNIVIINPSRLLKIEKIFIKSTNNEIIEIDTSNYFNITDIFYEEHSIQIIGSIYGLCDFTICKYETTESF